MANMVLRIINTDPAAHVALNDVSMAYYFSRASISSGAFIDNEGTQYSFQCKDATLRTAPIPLPVAQLAQLWCWPLFSLILLNDNNKTTEGTQYCF